MHGKSAYNSGEGEFERDGISGDFKGNVFHIQTGYFFLIERGM